jgi:hypothetical protein
VWSLGGTTYRFERRCVYCGVREIETRHGRGECDELRYEDGEPDDDAIATERRRLRRNQLARRRYAARRGSK